MLITAMGVASLLWAWLGLAGPSCGKVALLGGKVGKVNSASREMEPALGGVWAATSTQIRIDNANKYEFFMANKTKFHASVHQ